MKVELENYFNKSISCSVNESVRNCFYISENKYSKNV